MKAYAGTREINSYRFKCEVCGGEGNLELGVDLRRPFSCPEGCGATYVQWTPPDGIPELRCVVRPVYGKPRPEASFRYGDEDAE